MSQEGLVDIIGTHPEIPTEFVADIGSAIPILNILNVLGTTQLAGTSPVHTTGSGNTITTIVQLSQAVAAGDATKVGLSNFDSAGFSVSAAGFVTLNGGGGATTNIDVDAFTAPGTDPVVPSAGNIIMTGAQVAAGVVGANVIRTDSLAANTVTIEIQRSAAVGASASINNGVSHFNSTMFTVDANGFVSLLGGGEGIDSIAVQTGTSPVVPTVAGLVTINGAVVAAGTNPVRTDGTGANTMAVEVQISQALAATDATKIGLCNFDSSSFAVDANGFVTASGTGILKTLTGNSGGAIAPVAGNINTVGTGSITTAGAGNTLTTQLTGLTNHAVLVGAGTATITKVGPTATIGQVLQSAGAAADPAFSTATYPLTTTINQVLYSSAANTVTGLATANRAVMTTGTTGIPVMTALGADGQLIIGSTAGVPAAATLTAGTGISITNASNSITVAVSGSGVGQTITGDTGGALSPTAGNWNIKANPTSSTLPTSGSSVSFSGLGSTLSLSTTDANNNTLIGLQCGNATLSGTFQTGLGYGVLNQIGTGVYNIGLGFRSGYNYTGSESSNIMINNMGVLGESHVIRIGTQGNNNAEQNTCYIAGITGVAVSNLNVVTINTSTGQLGSQAAANVGTVTQFDVLVGGASGAIASVGPGSAGQVLQSGGAASNPVYSTATYPATTTSQQILYSTAANTVGQLTTANSALAATNSSGTLAMRAFSVVKQVFTAGGTYTPTSGMLYCDVICVGGGGAGGGAAATGVGQYSIGGGGGSGEYAIGVFSAATIGANQTVTIAAAATGNSGAAGNNGGTCSLGALITAAGGAGGITLAAGTIGGAQGGAGGTGGSGGSYRTPGSQGGNGIAVFAATVIFGGQGASGQLGSGGTTNLETAAIGGNGAGRGSGGGGATNTASLTAKVGGDGTTGIIIITEYVIA